MHTRGFSLIEMLIVITIGLILTTILLLNMNSYTDYIEIENQAYRLATAIREAQTKSISAQTLGNYESFGVYFNTASPGQAIPYGESVGTVNYKYDGSDVNFGTIILENGYTISTMCGSLNGSSCPDTDLTWASVTFVRPFLNADVRGRFNSVTKQYAFVRITLQSPKGKTRQLDVWSTGQVTVK